ncbi:MAG: hypothetical protein ACPGVB_10905 [Chitinophagales bacterium]
MKYLTLTLSLVLFFGMFSTQADNWELFPMNQKTYFYFESETEKTIVPYYVDFEEESGVYIRQYPLRAYIEEATGGCYADIDLNSGLNIPIGEIDYNPHILKSDAYFRYVFQKILS